MLRYCLLTLLLVALSTAFHVDKISSQAILHDCYLPREQPLVVPGVKKLNKGFVEHVILKNCTGVIDEATFKHFYKLKKLTIWKSDIEELNSPLPLTHIISVGSHLPTFSKNLQKNLPNLQAAMLLGNKDFSIDPMVFKDFKNLRALHISQANFTEHCITKEWFRGLEELQELSLSDNGLTCVAEDGLKNLRNLRKLDLTYNKIQYLDKTVFKKLSKLEQLGFYGNDLQEFDIGMLGNQKGHLEVLGIDWMALKSSWVTAEDISVTLPKLQYVSFGHEDMPNDFKAGEFCQALRQKGAKCETDSVFASGRILGYSLTT